MLVYDQLEVFKVFKRSEIDLCEEIECVAEEHVRTVGQDHLDVLIGVWVQTCGQELNLAVGHKYLVFKSRLFELFPDEALLFKHL